MFALHLGADLMHDAGANLAAAAQARRDGLQEIIPPIDRQWTGGGKDGVKLGIGQAEGSLHGKGPLGVAR